MKETSGSDDVTGEILAQALFEVPARPSHPYLEKSVRIQSLDQHLLLCHPDIQIGGCYPKGAANGRLAAWTSQQRIMGRRLVAVNEKQSTSDDSVIEGLRQDERDFCRREAWWQPAFPTTGLASPVHAPRWATIGGTIVLLSPHDELFKHQLPTPSMDHFPSLSSIVSPAAPARATSVGNFCRSRFFFCGSSWLLIRHTQLTAAQPIQRELIP